MSSSAAMQNSDSNTRQLGLTKTQLDVNDKYVLLFSVYAYFFQGRFSWFKLTAFIHILDFKGKNLLM